MAGIKVYIVKRIMTILLVTGVHFLAGAWAGDLEPTNPPGSTMHSLEEIFQNQEAMERRLGSDGMAETVDSMVLIPEGELRWETASMRVWKTNCHFIRSW